MPWILNINLAEMNIDLDLDQIITVDILNNCTTVLFLFIEDPPIGRLFFWPLDKL